MHFDDSFYIFFSAESHCTSNYIKTSCKTNHVKKKICTEVLINQESEQLNAPPVPV